MLTPATRARLKARGEFVTSSTRVETGDRGSEILPASLAVQVNVSMTGEQPPLTAANAGAAAEAAIPPAPQAPPGEPGRASPTVDQAVEGADHPRLARVFIAAALGLFITMVGLLCYRWLTVPAPSAFLQIEGDETHSGLVIEVNAGGGEAPRTATLSRNNKFTTRFPLPPGNYMVRILSKDGHQLGEPVPMTLHEAAGLLFDLNQNAPTRSEKSKDKDRPQEPAAKESGAERPAPEKPASE
jgi:hypothetical protein